MKKTYMSFDNREIIISGLGTRGDIHPLIGIAIELSNRGAKNIVFLLNDYYEELILSYGFSFYSTGLKEDHIKLVKDERTWKKTQDVSEIAWPLLAKKAVLLSYAYVKNNLYKFSEKPIILGIQPYMNGALWACEAYNLIGVNFTLSPHAIPSRITPPAPLGWEIPNWLPDENKLEVANRIFTTIERRVKKKVYFKECNQIRKKFGLSSIGSMELNELFSPKYKQIALFPSWFSNPKADWPCNIEITNFPLFDELKHEFRNEVDDFISTYGSPIVFSFGTGVHNTKDLFQLACRVGKSLNLPVLLVGGTYKPLDRQTQYIYKHIEYVDFEYLLPKSLILTHHGGIGNVAQSIAAGIPQLIRPTTFDQFDNAEKVKSLNVGDFLLPEYFKDTVERKIKMLISSRAVKNSIKDFNLAIKENNGINEASNLIETWAKEQS